MNWMTSRLSPGLRSKASDGPSPGPPGMRKITPRPVPWAGGSSERNEIGPVTIIGSGRVGSAVSARLRERGISVADDGDLVVLCVPDTAIAEVAQQVEPGPWIAHVSGATPLAALVPHTRRFSVHPLQ